MLYINIHDHIKNPQRQHEGRLKTGREEVGTGKNGTRCVPHGSVFAVPRHEVLVRQNAVRCNGSREQDRWYGIRDYTVCLALRRKCDRAVTPLSISTKGGV